MHEFLEAEVREIMHSRIWDLPMVEENTDIKTVLVVIIGRCYTWVVKDMKSMSLTGIITEHDALKLMNEYEPSIKAKDIMTENVVKASPDEKVKDVLDRMIEKGFRRMPVVENGKLVGEITLRHLIEKLYSLFF